MILSSSIRKKTIERVIKFVDDGGIVTGYPRYFEDILMIFLPDLWSIKWEWVAIGNMLEVIWWRDLPSIRTWSVKQILITTIFQKIATLIKTMIFTFQQIILSTMAIMINFLFGKLLLILILPLKSIHLFKTTIKDCYWTVLQQDRLRFFHHLLWIINTKLTAWKLHLFNNLNQQGLLLWHRTILKNKKIFYYLCVKILGKFFARQDWNNSLIFL